MEPTLAPGDRAPRRAGPGGSTPATSWRCATPGTARRVLVKRVGAVLDDEVVVRGDNPAASTDSRSLRARRRRARSSAGSSAATPRRGGPGRCAEEETVCGPCGTGPSAGSAGIAMGRSTLAVMAWLETELERLARP